MFHSDNKKVNRILVLMAAMSVTMCGCDAYLGQKANPATSGYDVESGTSDMLQTATDMSEADMLVVNIYENNVVDIATDITPAESENGSQMNYRITGGGIYVLRGSIDGSLTIDANEGLVNLVLENAYIDSSAGPALKIESAAKVIMTLYGDNTMRDSATYPGMDEDDGCISSNADITINGPGSLSVSGYHRDAIKCKDRIRIIDSTVSVVAKRNGIHGNDGVLICNASVDVQSEKDGLVTTKTGKHNKGLVEIVGGNVSIISGTYGINSKSDILIYDSIVWDRSVLGHYMAGNQAVIEEGCLQ